MNKFFGWDYVSISNIVEPGKVVRVWRVGDTPMFTPYPGRHMELKEPFDGWNVVPITIGAKEIMYKVNGPKEIMYKVKN